MTINAVELTSKLIEIPSVSEDEQNVLQFVYEYLCTDLYRSLGVQVDVIEIGAGRYNIFAHTGNPRICFTTHLDTVPGEEKQFKANVQDNRLFGRGACDAKGLAASMILAFKSLLESGEGGAAVLFVVGEETDGIGAKKAAEHFEENFFEYAINGEPTEGTLVRGHKGSITFVLRACGKSVHSGYPELGVDANRKILQLIPALYDLEQFEDHPSLGKTTVNIGLISGGTASNVISSACEIEGVIRVAGSASNIQERLRAIVEGVAELEVLGIGESVHLKTLEGYETSVAAYFTDIPFLRPIAKEFLMYGPGSITDAHTHNESIGCDELEQSVAVYVDLYQRLKA